jgi:hypothetical protein
MNHLKKITLIIVNSVICFSVSTATAQPPFSFKCFEAGSGRDFRFEVPADGKGDLVLLPGFPVNTKDRLPINGFGSKNSFRFGDMVEGGMFRNGVFYYHKHNSSTGTKVINGACKLI